MPLRPRRSLPAALALACLLACPTARAEPIRVLANGIVEYNQIMDPPLGLVMPGEAVVLTFLVDSDVFDDSAPTPTRGYPVDRTTFVLDFESTDIGLQDPYPVGQEAYFILRDNDPAVDGFILSPALSGGNGPPLDQAGAFGNFLCNYSVTYEGTRLSSLDILDALGFYDYTGLQVFSFRVSDGPFDPLGINFVDMTISRLNAPLEACCFADGSCMTLTPGDCAATTGLAQGAGTDCAGTPCPLPMEACCFPDGSCLDLTPADCATMAGSAQGPGSDCAGTVCPPPEEACCFDDGSCTDIPAADCAAMGGAGQGPGSDCASATCSQPTEACCLADGRCEDREPGDCASTGGTAQGAGTSCATASCLREPGRVPATIRVTKAGAGELRIDWESSACEPTADYGLHEGAIGSWYDHAPVACFDDLADRSETLPVMSGGRYFLVVAHAGLFEGSYGQDSTGSERPAATAACEAGQRLDCTP
jgi:hypothetical protein